MKAVKTGILALLPVVIFLAASKICCDTYIAQKDRITGRNKAFVGITAEKEDTVDVIVLGDSESYTAVSPMKLWMDAGIPAYNCGQSGQRMAETYFMLKTALKNQTPKVVIIETNVLFRYKGAVREVQTSMAETLRYYFPLLRYHNGWKLLFKDEKEPEEEYKGFPVREQVESYSSGEYMNETDAKAELSDFIQMCMDKIIKLCKENDIKLLLISAPSPVNYNYRKHNAIADYAKEKEIDYLDMNLEKGLGIDWKIDSLDKGDHLNLSGAHKATEYLAVYLKENYELPDHRTEEKYQEWNDEAELYKESAEKKLKKIRKEE